MFCLPKTAWPPTCGGGGRIHQFLWQRSRAASTREKGTEQRGVIRNHSELSQVARPSFGAG